MSGDFERRAGSGREIMSSGRLRLQDLPMFPKQRQVWPPERKAPSQIEKTLEDEKEGLMDKIMNGKHENEEDSESMRVQLVNEKKV